MPTSDDAIELAAQDPTGVDWSSVHPLGDRSLAQATLAEFATRWVMQVADVGEIGRYAAENQRLLDQPANGRRTVFLGDSITEFWTGLEALAPSGRQYINRGIAGQGTVQLLLRIQEDVIALSPQTLVLTAGTNDIRAFVGQASTAGRAALPRIARNLRSLCDIARANGVEVVLGSLTPVCDTPVGAQTVHRHPERIRDMNAWIRAHAERSDIGYLDWHAALEDGAGLMNPAYTDDGLHPNAEGYSRMAEVLAGSGLSKP